MKKQECNNCKFWKGKGLTDGRIGYCRRYPPLPDDNNSAEDMPGTTVRDWWCGEWKAKKAK